MFDGSIESLWGEEWELLQAISRCGCVDHVDVTPYDDDLCSKCKARIRKVAEIDERLAGLEGDS